MVKNVVIIGAGQAGFQTAFALRRFGFDGSISLISSDSEYPYQRPPLSKSYILGKIEKDSLFFRPPVFYKEHNINLIHAEAELIDRRRSIVHLSNQTAISYDHLVIATGASHRTLDVPGINLDGVYKLRCLDDADLLKERLKTAKRIIVIGAGFIGLEFASVASSLGLSVHVIDNANRPISRALSQQMSSYLETAHKNQGVLFSFGESISEVNGIDGKVCGVTTLSNKFIEGDIIVYGIGIIPNSDIAKNSGLDVNNGIRVNNVLLTSDGQISAAGDCASFSFDGKTFFRLESVQNATDHGTCIAARLSDQPTIYSSIPWFWSDQNKIKLQIAGLSNNYDSAILLGNIEKNSFSLLLFSSGRFIAAECVNRPGDFMAARKLLSAKTLLLQSDANQPGFEITDYEKWTRSA